MSVRRLANGSYQMDVVDVTGRRVRRNFRLKRAAEARERELIDAKERGERWSDTETFTDLWAGFEEVHKRGLRAQTWSGYRTHWVRHIQPDLGRTRVYRFEQPDAQAFVTRLENRGVSPMNARRVFATLSLLMGYGASEGRCRSVSARQVTFGRPAKYVPVVPTMAEAEAVAEAIHPLLAASVPLAIYATLRWGECFGLSPLSLMWERGQIHINRVLERRTGLLVDDTKGGRNGEPKTRLVTMPARVRTALRDHVLEYPDDYLVFHLDRRPISARWFHRQWDAAVERAGVRRFTYHGLRHAAVTVMIEAGWSLKEIQLAMGHASAAFTADRYWWLFEDAPEDKRDALDAVIGGVPGAGLEPARPRGAGAFEAPASASSATPASTEDTAP